MHDAYFIVFKFFSKNKDKTLQIVPTVILFKDVLI